MKRSTQRILTTHAGSLPQPEDLKQMLAAKDGGKPYDEKVLTSRVRSVVAEVVKKQLECGIDVVNDGEIGKSSFSRYVRERLSGFIERQAKPEERPSAIFGRDLAEFPEYFQKRLGTVHRRRDRRSASA